MGAVSQNMTASENTKVSNQSYRVQLLLLGQANLGWDQDSGMSLGFLWGRIRHPNEIYGRAWTYIVIVDQGWRRGKRCNCFELVIKDHVILRRNLDGMDVQYQCSQRRMDRRETNKHPKMCTRIPFWNLPAMLKLRFENIDRATKDMSSSKLCGRDAIMTRLHSDKYSCPTEVNGWKPRPHNWYSWTMTLPWHI